MRCNKHSGGPSCCISHSTACYQSVVRDSFYDCLQRRGLQGALVAKEGHKKATKQ